MAVVILDHFEALHVHAAKYDGGIALAVVIAYIPLQIGDAELGSEPVAAFKEILLHIPPERIEKGIYEVIQLSCQYAVDGVFRFNGL